MFLSEPVPGDITTLRWLNQQSSAGLDDFFLAITHTGGAAFVALTVLALTVVLARHNRQAAAVVVFLGVFGASIVNMLLKLVFERPRPELWQQIIDEQSYSFPSGHAMASSALAFCIVAVLWRTRWRWWAVGLGAVYVILVGLSRLYLGVHYPSDVVAGWGLSLLWVALVCFVVRRRFASKS